MVNLLKHRSKHNSRGRFNVCLSFCVLIYGTFILVSGCARSEGVLDQKLLAKNRAAGNDVKQQALDGQPKLMLDENSSLASDQPKKNSELPDMKKIQQMIVDETTPNVIALFDKEKSRKDEVVAIGYVYSFGAGRLYFTMSANTKSFSLKTLQEWKADEISESEIEEYRWNSGDYYYSAGAEAKGFSTQLWSELRKLDSLATKYRESDNVEALDSIHEEFGDICCQAMAELAKRGVLGEISKIDFNVASLYDQEERVKNRDQKIRDLISTE